jgi:hypothetical protein
MKFKIGREREAAGMQFQTQPRRPTAPPAGRKDAPGRGGVIGHPSAGSQFAAETDELLGQPRIEAAAAEAERGRGERLASHGLASPAPSHPAMARRIGEERGEPEARDRPVPEAGQKFAAYAVPRIIARLKNRYGNIRAPQGRAECEAGEAAANDFNGPFHLLCAIRR